MLQLFNFVKEKNCAILFVFSLILLDKKNQSKYEQAKIHYLKNKMIYDINTSNAYGYEMIKKIVVLMQKFGWDTRSFSKRKKNIKSKN